MEIFYFFSTFSVNNLTNTRIEKSAVSTQNKLKKYKSRFNVPIFYFRKKEIKFRKSSPTKIIIFKWKYKTILGFGPGNLIQLQRVLYVLSQSEDMMIVLLVLSNSLSTFLFDTKIL